MRIVTIDPVDAGAVAAWHRIYLEVGFTDNPDGFVPSPPEEVQEVLRVPTARFAFTAFLGFVDGEPVASGWSAFGLKDAPHLAYLTPRVLPARRRRGYGTQMLHRMEHHAAEHRRTLFQAAAVWAPAHGPDGATSAPVRFAAGHGWELGLTNLRLRLDLPTDQGRLDELIAQRASKRDGYRIRTWVGPVPNDLLPGWAILHAAVSADAPHGALEHQMESADPDAIRDDERILTNTGRTTINAAAISPGGDIVAYSSILTRLDHPDPGFQQGTIVRTDHRGRGLGALAKVQALRLLERTRPDIPAVITENALDNEHMVALNQSLGGLPVLYSGDFQKRTT